MELSRAIEILTEYNKWRVGDVEDAPMLEPSLITIALDVVIADYNRKQKSAVSLQVKGSAHRTVEKIKNTDVTFIKKATYYLDGFFVSFKSFFNLILL